MAYNIISSIVRGMIARSPSLFVRARAKDFETIASFLQDGDLTLADLERLARRMTKGKDSVLRPDMIRNAIADCYRDDEEETERIRLCGGWLWSEPYEKAMP